MNPEEAEEFTKGLDQIVSGVWRQVDEGARLGVPQALGLSTSEWAQTRLGKSPAADAQAPPQAAEDAAPLHAEEGGRHQLVTDGASASRGELQLRQGTARRNVRRGPKIWLVVPFCGAIGLLGGLAATAATTPTYEAESAAFVSMTALPVDDPNSNDPFGSSQFALQRVQSYAQLATSPQVIQGAMRDLHLGDGAAPDVKVTTTGGVMLWVTATDRDPHTAARMADAVMANLVRSVATLEAGGGPHSPIQLVPVQPAIVPDAPEGNGALVKTLIGLLGGVGLGGAAYYVIRSRYGGRHQKGAARGYRRPPVRPSRPRPRQELAPSFEPPARPEAKPERRVDGDVMVLRIGDGREFPRRPGQ
ncbi:hypothetical protein [Mycobacterium sp. Marseille-P9652]|uniref:hypothetical protein n=1 Tax=Mycobacterium sp. Marseille-P9652 TaxID=2654950 RepID=UPI0012E842C1|nr:hypothetical protein [Mycobacterium sp. Marseille-P9652]